MDQQKTSFTWIDRAVVYIIMAALVIALFIYLRNCNHSGSGNEIPRPPDTLRSVNKAGDSVVSLKGREIDFTVIEQRIKDSIARVYDFKESRLQELIIAQTRTIAELSAIGPTSIDYTTDTSHPECPPIIKRMRQEFTNPHYTAQVQVGDSSYMHLQGYDTLTGNWHSVVEGKFLRKKTYQQLDLSFADTSRHITGILAWRAPREKPKKFGIGASAGVTWNGKWAPYAGIGLNWTFIRF